jgi:hypothetical protein
MCSSLNSPISSSIWRGSPYSLAPPRRRAIRIPASLISPRIPNGQAFVSQISGTGRPDLQRRAYELLADLGPRLSRREDFAPLGPRGDLASRRVVAKIGRPRNPRQVELWADPPFLRRQWPWGRG